ncbi:CaiB/BaiF CoA transferase family protein [Thermomonospora echinospora]|uniref:CaiB/BaiF CoA transferase family protein n=1 Tax=Thermomonospora echinospora TaxID=1992 RepID=UPI001356802A|nr:CoA transferase [Thermomonospora echinospora]
MTVSGPLAGVRVLDFSTTFSGPYCTHQLADLGAEVIKVESPGGDITRGLGTARSPGMASVYVASNRNKASLELDLKRPGSRELVRSLIERADCLVHNMRLGAARRLGLDPETALAVNPRLVHAAITGFGSDGPYAGRPAYDDTVQAASGLAWLQSLGGRDEAYMATAVADKVAGLAAAQAVIAALFWRERTGRGQAVEVPMYETVVAFTLMEQWGGRAFVPPLGPTGYARMRSAHRRPYRTADGLISVVVYHEGHWRRFLEFTGHADLLDEERFRTVEARNANIDELYALLARLLTRRTTADWLKIFDEIDVPAMPVRTLDEVLDDEHLRAVRFFQEVTHPEEGAFLAARHATRFSASPPAPPSEQAPPDRLGDGRDAVRRWLDDRPRAGREETW